MVTKPSHDGILQLLFNESLIMTRWTLLLCLIFGQTVRADNWPSVRNGTAQQGVAASALQLPLELRWEVSDNDGFVASAAIYEGRVYVGALSGHFRCLDLTDGSEIWSMSTPADKSDFRPGFSSPPTVTEDSVYVGDEDGTFYALDPSDGSIRWKKSTDDQIVGGATVLGNRVLFGSHDGKLYCVDAKTGEENWFVLTDGPVNCSIAVATDGQKTRTFVAGCDELLRVIDAETGEEVGTMPLGSPLIASPAIVDDALYVGSYAGQFSSIDWTTLKAIWTHESERGQPIHSSAAIGKNTIVVGGRDRQLRAFDRRTGDILWEIKTRSKIDSSPVISGNLAFVGTGDKRILAVDLKSGEIEWEYATGSPVAVGPAVADGCLVIGTEGPRGRLLCFESAAK